mgnify:CR=1 FL=1
MSPAPERADEPAAPLTVAELTATIEDLLKDLGRVAVVGEVTGVTQATVIDLWDNWYVLGLFVGLVSLEWFLRKRRGLV